MHDGGRAYVDAPAAAITGDGRYVAFVSYAPLVAADEDARADVYVFDRVTDTVTLESGDGIPGGTDCVHPGISDDGRLLAYQSASALNGALVSAVVVHDRAAATGTPIRAAASFVSSRTPAVSRGGRFVVFASASTTLVAGVDANGHGDDVYLADVETGAIERVSVGSDGRQRSAGASFAPAISADGRFVVFTSTAPLEKAVSRGALPERPRISQVYLRDRTRNVTTLVSSTRDGTGGNGSSWAATIAEAGRVVAFVSTATNLAQEDRERGADVLVADLESQAIELITRTVRGGPGNGPSASPALSADGRFVAFQSDASDLLCARACAAETEDINLLPDVFVFDRSARSVTRASGDKTGWLAPSVSPAIDAVGSVVVFSSRHPIDAADTKNDYDLFIRSAARPSDPRAPRAMPAGTPRPPRPR